MKQTWIFITCLSLISTSTVGCYSSSFITPPSDVREHSGRIEYLIAKGGMMYRFDSAPDIVQDKIVGPVNGRQVSIPVSDVVTVRMKKTDWVATSACVVAGGLLIGGMAYLVSNQEFHFDPNLNFR